MAAAATGRRVPATGHTVALVGFSNLSGNAKDAWVAPAVVEMLDAELNVENSVQSVPSELVRDASVDLSPPSAGGYSAATLERLRQRLHADYVISGSYLVSSPRTMRRCGWTSRCRTATRGRMVAAISRQSDIGGLIALASEAGARAAAETGRLRTAGAQTLARVANLRPPSVDVARRVGFALDALQHYDPARARDELLEAVAEAPEYAPTYTYLSQAWSALGYHDKALAAAEQAAARSAELPAEERPAGPGSRQRAHAGSGRRGRRRVGPAGRAAARGHRLPAARDRCTDRRRRGHRGARQPCSSCSARPAMTRVSSSPRHASPALSMTPRARRATPPLALNTRGRAMRPVSPRMRRSHLPVHACT